MARWGRAVFATVYEEETRLGPLRHLVLHSPDGFEWGYGGSGPADLARSIVGDVTGERDPSPRKYQLVKDALIATLPEKGGVITEDQVLQVLRDYLDRASR